MPYRRVKMLNSSAPSSILSRKASQNIMNAFENLNSYVQNFDSTNFGGGADDQVSFGLMPEVETVLVGLTSHMGQKYADDGKTLVLSGRYRIAYLSLQKLQGLWCPIIVDYADLYSRRTVTDANGVLSSFTPSDLESKDGIKDDLYATTRACPGRRDLAAKAFADLYRKDAKVVAGDIKKACDELLKAKAVFAVAGVYVNILLHKDTLHCLSKKGKAFDFQPYLVHRVAK